MLGVGWGEIMVAALAALLILGPGRLPEAARTAGQAYGRLHRFLSEARAALRAELDLADLNRPASPPAPPDTIPPRAEDQGPQA
ncbi:MAG: twin-arginine translocase TatA/TatE family subunit [Candidatus Adiutrix sp.]|jgi:sec-independent protein translocase protein TatB|nr:twin-arginine translocase TatA/TatE family subunit [Candidatus Adiutrix sp.]